MGHTKSIAIGIGGLAAATATIVGATARFNRGQHQADSEWKEKKYSRLDDIGEVESLSILPLVDWYTARDDLVGEPGVSYLVKADETTEYMRKRFGGSYRDLLVGEEIRVA